MRAFVVQKSRLAQRGKPASPEPRGKLCTLELIETMVVDTLYCLILYADCLLRVKSKKEGAA